MREQIEQRLAELRSEHETGARMLAELEVRQAQLQQTLLRIGGAVQVMEELIATEPAETPTVGDSLAEPPTPMATVLR